MNHHQRLLRVRAQIRLVELTERGLQRDLTLEFQRVLKAASKSYPQWENATESHEKNLLRILRTNLARGASGAVSLALDVAKSYSIATERKSGELNVDTEDELRARAVTLGARQAAKKVVGISRVTRQRIRDVIEVGLENDKHPDEIARDIYDINDMTRARARTIARTESHQIVMTAEHDSMTEISDELNIKMKKIWVSSDDDRTRESHSEANGQKVELDEAFIVGGVELLHPGDPDGPPEEVINCRCGVVYEV